MKKVAEITAELQQKVEKILDGHKATQQQLKSCEQELAAKKEELKKQQEEIEGLQEKIKILKLAKSMTVVKGQSPELKHKINELVREIDNCIAMLNR